MQPVSIHREWFILEGVSDHQGDELFGELVGAIIVRTAQDDGREAVCVDVGAYEQIGSCLARRIGAAGIEGSVFSEILRGRGASVHLIGADLDKKRHTVLTRRFQQQMGPYDVRGDKAGRVFNAPIHVGFRGEVDNRIEARGQHFLHGPGIANIGLDKPVAGMANHIS